MNQDLHYRLQGKRRPSCKSLRAYLRLPVIISNCSNNYGPNQFPEKLIPLAINNFKNNKLSLFMERVEKYTATGSHVEDHAEAIDMIFPQG
jgi:dTDP-glucose 4,6-dehydratase